MIDFFSKIGSLVSKVTNVFKIGESLVALAGSVVKRIKQIFSGNPETYNAKENEDGSDTTNLPQ